MAACSSSASPPKGARTTKFAGHNAVEQGSGTTAVVMIHGKSTHKDSWFPLMPKLAAAGYWAIAYDYDSQGSGDLAEIVAYARAHGAKRLVLAGSSLGAQHALEAADALHADAVITFSSEVEHTIREPLLAIASVGDGDTVTYARHNVDTAKHSGAHDTKIVEVKGSTHGIDMVNPHPEVMKVVTDWLRTVLAR
jgi:alpha-beta hydrolase superfamily lysophospholipase